MENENKNIFFKKVMKGVSVIAVIAVGAICVICSELQDAEEIHITLPKDIPITYEVFCSDGDDDGDTLTNETEKTLGTNYKSSDTDKDGLQDQYEIEVSKTKPTVIDTDGDGLSDGLEIKLSLDPLKVKTDDITPDGALKFDKTYSSEEFCLAVSGDANVHNITAGKAMYCDLKGVPGVVTDVYEFYMDDMHFEHAQLTLSYDTTLGSEVDVDNLAIYQLMNDTSFVKVEGSVINEKEKTISVNLEHFSKYFVGDTSVINKGESEVQVFLLLDDSGSMYPEEICKGSDENDTEFKRIDFALDLLEQSEEHIKYGLAKFTGTYYSLSDGFNSSREELTQSLNAIKEKPSTFNGTHIGWASISAIKNFSKSNDARKFVILLTDGATTESGGFSYDADDIVKKAKEKNIAFIVVGLGSKVDETYLRTIADGTGGIYVYASNPDAIEQVQSILTQKIDYNYVDLDGNGEYDHILIADSGFKPERDGFSFDNYFMKSYYSDELVGGQCYGMARFCQLYYKGKLLLQGEEVKKHHAGGILGGGDLEALSYDLTKSEFFTGSEYVSNKVGLYNYSSLLTELEQYTKLRRRDKEDKYKIIYHEDFYEFISQYPNLIKVCIKEVSEKNQPVYYSDKKEYRSYELWYVDLSVSYNELTEKEKEHYEFFMSLHNMYTHQDANEDEVNYIDKQVKLSDTVGSNEENFEALVNLLQNGIPGIVTTNGHAVNGISLYRDIENPNKYKMMIYDNNYAGETRYIEIVRRETTFWDVSIESITNEYKHFIYDSFGTFTGKGDEVSPVGFCYSAQLSVNQ